MKNFNDTMEKINPHKDVFFYRLLIAGIFTMLSVMILLGMDIMEIPFEYKLKVVILLVGVGIFAYLFARTSYWILMRILEKRNSKKT